MFGGLTKHKEFPAPRFLSGSLSFLYNFGGSIWPLPGSPHQKILPIIHLVPLTDPPTHTQSTCPATPHLPQTCPPDAHQVTVTDGDVVQPTHVTQLWPYYGSVYAISFTPRAGPPRLATPTTCTSAGSARASRTTSCRSPAHDPITPPQTHE